MTTPIGRSQRLALCALAFLAGVASGSGARAWREAAGSEVVESLDETPHEPRPGDLRIRFLPRGTPGRSTTEVRVRLDGIEVWESPGWEWTCGFSGPVPVLIEVRVLE